jgi:hypothetical protein
MAEIVEFPKNVNYVLISDKDEVPALFKIENGTEQIRMDGEWTDPTWEQIEELEGLMVATIEEKFVEVYDEIQASKKVATTADIEPYKTETSL